MTILNVFVRVLVEVDLEVTTTVVVHKTPDFSPSIVAAVIALLEDKLLLDTVELSASAVVFTSICNPALGSFDDTFT